MAIHRDDVEVESKAYTAQNCHFHSLGIIVRYWRQRKPIAVILVYLFYILDRLTLMALHVNEQYVYFDSHTCLNIYTFPNKILIRYSVLYVSW